MNPNCGNTDKIVNTSDNAQIFNDLSAVIFLSVGRILLEKNSLTYIKMLLFFIFTSIKIYHFYETQSHRMVCESQPQTLAATYSPAIAVPSAHTALTSLFGMGRGDFCML
jgi:hypothetical protein